MADDKKQLDTGTGGIDINGRLYTLDVGVDDVDGGDQGEWSSGNIHVDNTEKDISTPTKKTLGEYLSNVTKAKVGSAKIANKYPVDATVSPTPITNDKGYPAAIIPSTNSEQFAGDIKSGRSNDARDLRINRGLSEKQYPDGNELLPNVTDVKSPVAPYVSSVLSSNRWSPTTPLQGVPTLKTGFQKGTSTVSTEVSLNRLATVGATLSERASLELGSTTDAFNPNGTFADASALLPGTAQLAVERVNVALLNAEDVLNHLTTTETDNFINPNAVSWGTMNDVNDQFAGLSAIGMIALSTALVAALQVAIEALFLMFSIGQTPKKHPTRDTLGRYSVGSYYYGAKPKDTTSVLGAVTAVASLDLGTLLGIQPTNFPFTVALKKGSRAFFGIDDSSTASVLLSTGLARMAENPGFNAVVARTIIRSSLSLIEKTRSINGNPINVSKQIVGLIDVLKSSKIISACNVFAQLGDAILSIPERTIDANSVGPQKVSSIDALDDDTRSAVSKSRMKNSLKLAWAQDRTNTLLLLPKNITSINAAGKNLGAFNGVLATGGQNSLTKTSTVETGRIDQSVIEQQEAVLDAEYVPFYFHDLRTNEIISFHAFLTSLSDDFSVNYEASEGYGRVEPVKKYRSTTRAISVSFMIASTSVDDFDNMWIKINKLVTLLYPQYTPGKLITDGNGYTIRQPFSQLIGASPMIRLRLGDLFKTNYSRFALARLFGLGDPDMTLNNKKLQNVVIADEDLNDYNNKRLQVALSSPVGLTFVPGENFYQLYDETKLGSINIPPGISLGLGGLNTTNQSPSPVFKQQGNTYMCKVVKRLDDNNVVGEVNINTDLSSEESRIASGLGTQLGSENNFLGGKYVFPNSVLKNTKSTDIKMYNKIIGVNPDDFATELSSFLSTDVNSGNAIAKSFKTMEGKGLAGFIESMNFDWFDNVQWETTSDRKAPKMCKVSFSFAPIHDISPGVDSQGYNRAPIYGVGQMAPGEVYKK